MKNTFDMYIKNGSSVLEASCLAESDSLREHQRFAAEHRAKHRHGRIMVESEKLAVDSVALDKIIKIVEDWHAHYAPDRAQQTLGEISDIIDERGD